MESSLSPTTKALIFSLISLRQNRVSISGAEYDGLLDRSQRKPPESVHSEYARIDPIRNDKCNDHGPCAFKNRRCQERRFRPITTILQSQLERWGGEFDSTYKRERDKSLFIIRKRSDYSDPVLYVIGHERSA